MAKMITTWPFRIDKSVITIGTENTCPTEFSRCRVSLKLMENHSGLDDCHILQEYSNENSLEIVVGSGLSYVAAAVDVCVQTMRTGETSSFKIYRQQSLKPVLHCYEARSFLKLCVDIRENDLRTGAGVNGECPSESVRGKADMCCGENIVKNMTSSSAEELQQNLSDKCETETHKSEHQISSIEQRHCNLESNGDAGAQLNLSCNDDLVPLLTVEISMISFDLADTILSLTSETLLERCLMIKEQGVTSFKSSDIVMAFYKFSRAVKYLMCLDTEDPMIKQKKETLLSQCYSNTSACQLQINNFVSAKENATKCLSYDQHNVKALFRRAQAALKLEDWETAIEDLQNALQVEPNNKLMMKYLKEANEQRKAYSANLSNSLSKMFK